MQRFADIDPIARDEPADLPVLPGPESATRAAVHERGEEAVGEQALNCAPQVIATGGGSAVRVSHAAADYTVAASNGDSLTHQTTNERMQDNAAAGAEQPVVDGQRQG